ncbi:SHQ1 protein-domain-containing protein [Mrakia frigida]|uniref:Hsp90 cochaperone SHQ1 n=1 Tax=Mrakia frigida TaxID=29902 RepID=UPI003FCC14ED
MLTPSFHLSQTPESLIITALCPAINSTDIEIHTQDTHFSLHIPPYFLRLSLPGPCIEDDSSSAKYDPPTGALVVSLTKLNKGDEFVGLDDMDRLLSSYNNKKPVVIKDEDLAVGPEVVRDERMEELLKERKILLEAEANSWLLPQSAPAPSSSSQPTGSTSSLPSQPYGFLSSHSSLFRHPPPIAEELIQHLGPNPETTTPEERLRLAEEAEDERFDSGYYQGDFVYDEEIGEVLRWQAPLSRELREGKVVGVSEEEYFTEEEKEVLKEIPVREYPPSTPPSHLLHPLLLLLLSQAYDTRQTLSDPTLESPWTLTSLLPLFTSLTPCSAYPTIPAVLRASYRRMVSYPLYRSWALAAKVKEDVCDVLEGGRKSTLRALLGMKKVLESGEGYEVFVKVWVEDYVGWVMRGVNDEVLVSLSRELRSTVFTQAETGWPLAELEAETREGEGDIDLD